MVRAMHTSNPVGSRRIHMGRPARRGLLLVAALAAAMSCSNKERGKKSSNGQTGQQATPTTPLATMINFDQKSESFAAFQAESVRLAAMQYPALKEEVVEAPISLTADDGTGLVLEGLDARAVIEGPLAFTELHMRFRNPLSRTLEGRFQVTLPEGASVSRLSMKVNGNWQEAEMVERQAARRAYEDFLHRKQDPMLLEKEAGNQFRARIFPIPPNSIKEVIVSYSHELSASHGYQLPLKGLPMVGELKVKALVAEADGSSTRYKTKEMNVKGTVPTEDFKVEAPASLQALRQGTHVVARVTPSFAVKNTKLEGLTILFDTSASRAPGFARQVQRLGSLVEALAAAQGASLPLRVAAFDQETSPVYEGAIGEFGKNDLALLLARRPLGASDLGAALKWAGKLDAKGRVLIVSDAVTTAGESELAGIAKALPEGITRIDTLLVGGIRDREAAGRIVRGTRSEDGVVLRDDLSDAELARRIGAATATMELSIAGAEWNWPKTVHGIQPGDEVVLYGAFASGKTPGEVVEVQVKGSDSLSLKSALVPGQLLTRSVVQAQIARSQNSFIEETDAAKKAELKTSIIGLSTKYRVLSDHTALLVLETDNDYRRFGIDRKALVDILTVQDAGLGIQQKQREFRKVAPVPATVANNRPQPRDEMPMEEEELESDDSEESGGTGTKMAEAEGKMGKKESTRATGQFAMKGATADPAMAKSMAMDSAAEALPPSADGFGQAGIGPGGGGEGSGSIGSGRAGNSAAASGAPAPSRAPRSRPRADNDARKRSRRGVSATEEKVAERPSRTSRPQSLRRPPTPRPPPPPEPEPVATTTAWGDTGDSQPAEVLQATVDPSIAAKAAEKNGPPALTGTMAEIRKAIDAGQFDAAVAKALSWRTEESGNVMALVALGEALESAGKNQLAARAYGSIIDLFPSRADLRRFASARLVALKSVGEALSVDSLQKAAEQRPDHLSVHRLLAYALVRKGDLEGAFAALETGLKQRYPGGRFNGGIRILREDLGIVGAAWQAKDKSKAKDIEKRLRVTGARLATKPSLRFVLNWETDANDVDFHIYDGQGGHAFYSQRKLNSGGELFDDVTTGYGPECFAIEGKTIAYPYAIQIHYYSRGPMGY